MSRGPISNSEVQRRITRLKTTQKKLADRLGICQASLSGYINEAYPWPPGLEERAKAELDILEAAERAAQEARELVLAEAGSAERAAQEARRRALAGSAERAAQEASGRVLAEVG